MLRLYLHLGHLLLGFQRGLRVNTGPHLLKFSFGCLKLTLEQYRRLSIARASIKKVHEGHEHVLRHANLIIRRVQQF